MPRRCAAVLLARGGPRKGTAIRPAITWSAGGLPPHSMNLKCTTVSLLFYCRKRPISCFDGAVLARIALHISHTHHVAQRLGSARALPARVHLRWALLEKKGQQELPHEIHSGVPALEESQPVRRPGRTRSSARGPAPCRHQCQRPHSQDQRAGRFGHIGAAAGAGGEIVHHIPAAVACDAQH
jgi:hypothetical protein